MQVFQVIRTLETRKIEGNIIGDYIDPDLVILITDDDSRTIYIYSGEKSPLVDRLIAERLASEIRKYLRGFYSIKKLDDPEAIETIKNTPITVEGKVPEIYNPTFHENQSTDSENEDKNENESNSQETKKFDDSSEGKIILQNDDAWRHRLSLENMKIFGKTNIQEIQKEVLNLKTIPGKKSEMLLIGTAVYNRSNDISSFFGENNLKKRYTSKLRKLGNLPEGYFFYPNYSSRLIIKGGRLKALEFIKELDEREERLEDDPKKGIILAPVLFRKDISANHSFDVIKKNFKIKNEETIDNLIERAKKYREENQEED